MKKLFTVIAASFALCMITFATLPPRAQSWKPVRSLSTPEKMQDQQSIDRGAYKSVDRGPQKSIDRGPQTPHR